MSDHDRTVSLGIDPELTKSIKVITDNVPEVASGYAAQGSAIASQRSSEAALLSAVVDITKPAFPALVNKLAVGCVGGQLTWYDRPGFVISADPDACGPQVIYTTEDQGDGVYSGCAALVIDDGTFRVFRYSGTQLARRATWRAEVTTVTAAELLQRYAFRLERMITVIGLLLQRDRHGRIDSMTRARTRSSKIKAILALLEA